MRENNRRMRKNEEMFLFCPPEVECLATPLRIHENRKKNVVYMKTRKKKLFLTIKFSGTFDFHQVCDKNFLE